MEHEPVGGVLGWLDGPRLVVGAFAFFLLGLTILGILLWADQREQVRRIDSIIVERQKEQRTANRQTVERCFANANSAPALSRVLDALEASVSTSADRQALRNFRELNELNSNTLRECRQLAKKLDVPIPKGVR